MRYVAGFIYDNTPPFDNESDDGEWIIERDCLSWLIDALIEYMPTRNNSELFWACSIDDDGTEIDLTNKIKEELKRWK
jgi:hypothetical protein